MKTKIKKRLKTDDLDLEDGNNFKEYNDLWNEIFRVIHKNEKTRPVPTCPNLPDLFRPRRTKCFMKQLEQKRILTNVGNVSVIQMRIQMIILYVICVICGFVILITQILMHVKGVKRYIEILWWVEWGEQALWLVAISLKSDAVRKNCGCAPKDG